MKKRRLLSLALSLLIILSMFAGCSINNNQTSPEPSQSASPTPDQSTAPDQESPTPETPEENEEPPTTPEEPAPTPAESLPLTEESVQLSLFTGMMPPAMSYIDSMENCYVYEELARRTGVTMKIEAIHPSTQAEKYNLMAATGDYTDLINGVANMHTGGVPSAIEQEVIIELTDVINNFVPNYSDIIFSDLDIYKDVTLDNGSIGAFYNLFTKDEYADNGPMIRSDWLQALGLETPKTYDQYYEVLKAFKSEYGATMWIPATGIVPSLINGYDIMGGYSVGMTVALDCYYVVDDTIKTGWLEEGFKEYLTMMNKWFTEGLIDPDYVSGDAGSTTVNNQPNALSGLLTGKYGIWHDDIAAMDTYSLDDGPFPAAPTYYATKNEGDMIHVGYYTSRINGPSFSISSTCKDTELAARYINYLYSEEGSMLCNWGVEDFTYVVNADGSKSFTDLIANNSEGMPYNVAQFVYLMDTGPFVLDRDRMRTTFSEAQLACYDIWQSNYDQAWTRSTQLALTTEESEAYSTIMGDLLTYVSESINKFIVGELSIEKDYNNFVSTLISLNIEDCVDYYQNAYDRWNAKEM